MRTRFAALPRVLALVVPALLAYALAMGTMVWLIAFLADLPMFGRTIDRPVTALGWPRAVAVDLALVGVFGLQHTVMARRGFKAWWTRRVPEALERSGYLVFTCLALWLLLALWQPVGPWLWDLRGSDWGVVLFVLGGAGWAIVLVSTFLIDHFALFGLSQAWSATRRGAGASSPAPRLCQPLFYRVVRHPLYTGFLIAFWAAPAMSAGHLLFAATMTLYVLVALVYEERDLVATFGAEYEAYRARVGKLLPRWW